MADMTFNCPRLKCPRSCSRQVGPWARKISATSRALRGTSQRYVGRELSKGLKTLRNVSVATWV